jgi:hypothetical protein
MRSHQKVFAVAVLALLIVGFVADSLAQPPPVTCDNKCRMRTDYYQCGTTGNRSCVHFTLTTCLPCTPGVLELCVDAGDWSPLFPNCYSTNYQTPYAFYSGCTTLCPCTGVANVEASPTSLTATDFIAGFKCQQ